MTVALVGSGGNETNERLVAGWRSLGIHALLLSGVEARARLDERDVAVGRIDVLPTLDGVEPGLLDLLLLERTGVPVRNRAFSLLAVHDKLLTARRLEAAGIPHPRTGWVRTAEEALPVPPPLVVKPRFGSWGKDVFRCGAEREARRLLRMLAGRRWFRRHGACKLGAAAAAAVGGDLVGVDLLPLAAGGYVAVELNGAVDFDEAYALPGGDVFRESAAALALEARGRLAVA